MILRFKKENCRVDSECVAAYYYDGDRFCMEYKERKGEFSILVSRKKAISWGEQLDKALGIEIIDII